VRPAAPSLALGLRSSRRGGNRSRFRFFASQVTIVAAIDGTPRRALSVPRPAFGGAMLTLLRLPFVTGLGVALVSCAASGVAMLTRVGCILNCVWVGE
jgi:hypothetical protein